LQFHQSAGEKMDGWIPPRSPYDLLQERFWPDGWKVLVVCLMLNQTSRKQVEPMIHDFFHRFPTPESVVDADDSELLDLISPLGLSNRRLKTLKRFSEEFVTKSWKEASELYGVGKYADDTYRIFIRGEWMSVQPDDHALVDYWGYLRNKFQQAQSHA